MVVPSHPHTASVVLTDLRQATANAHRTLEARLPFLQPDFTRQRYIALLKAYYGFYQPLEQVLRAQALPATLYYAQRQKTAALADDLAALGLSRAHIEQLPRCRTLPQVDDCASAFGVLYVLEGSTLGGQILLRAVRSQLQIDPASGASFLDIYGTTTGQRWRAFLHALSAIKQPDARLRCTRAASATFALFQAWLDSQEVLNDA